MNTNANLQIFSNNQFGKVRILINENNEPLFVASDVAKSLSYTNPQKAIRDHCKGVTKRSGVSATTNQYGKTSEQTIEFNFIPESDVYILVAENSATNYFADKNDKKFGVLKNCRTFVVSTVNGLFHFAEQSVNLLKSYLGFFIVQNLRYRRLPLRKLLLALRSGLLTVDSVKCNRFLFDKVCQINNF